MNDLTTKAPASATKPVDYQREIPGIIQHMVALQQMIEQHGIDKKLLYLVKLRASQINGCAHCVKMHTRESRAIGETNERLDHLVVWKHVAGYSERERAGAGLDGSADRPRQRAGARAAARAAPPALHRHGDRRPHRRRRDDQLLEPHRDLGALSAARTRPPC